MNKHNAMPLSLRKYTYKRDEKSIRVRDHRIDDEWAYAREQMRKNLLVEECEIPSNLEYKYSIYFDEKNRKKIMVAGLDKETGILYFIKENHENEQA